LLFEIQKSDQNGVARYKFTPVEKNTTKVVGLFHWEQYHIT